jgi:hypothetical protein
MKKSFFIINILVLLFTSSGDAIAQTSFYTPLPTQGQVRARNELLLWATAGAGAVGPGLGGLLKLTSVWDEHSLSAKLQGGGKLNLVHSGSSEAVTEFSLYYGRQMINEYSIFRGAAGPALFVHSSPNFTHLGIGVEFEAMAKFGPVGISSMISLMAAPEVLYVNFTINLSLGKLFYLDE